MWQGIIEALRAVFGYDAPVSETAAGYALTGVDYALVEIDQTPYPANATMQFHDDGRLSGRGPCNAWNAQVTVPYPWFETTPIASTRALCAAIDQETLFFATLGQMTVIEASGNTLILSTPNGPEMVFQAPD